jgi:ABC-type transport system involved in cytochrome bd biosynthesis fused ATPase/permease subunit
VEDILDAQNLCFAYESSTTSILQNIELDVAPGEFIATVGMWQVDTRAPTELSGLIPPSSGSIAFDGGSEEIRRLPMGYNTI